MSWNTGLCLDCPIVETRYCGRMTYADRSAAAEKTLALADSLSMTRLLADCSALNGGYSVADLFVLTDGLRESRQHSPIRIAILSPTLTAMDDAARFWETTCYCRGTTIRIFKNRLIALDWLQSADPISHRAAAQPSEVRHQSAFAR